LPSTLAPSSQLTLAPGTGVVKVEDILRLQQIPSAVLPSIADPAAGDIALSSDADAGQPAICFYTGTEWKFLPGSVLSSLGD